MHEILTKYHNHKLNKKQIKQLTEINKSFKLGLNPHKLHDFLILSVYETSLNNKSTIEKKFEEIRNQHFDMWEHIQFQERNTIVLKIYSDEMKNLPHFKYDDIDIYIPFFNVLLNTLYGTKTAILELPQFFKLYTNYLKDTEDIFKYGLQPFINNMSAFEYIYGTDPIVLFGESTFVVFDEEKTTAYPLLKDIELTKEEKETLGILLCKEDLDTFFGILINKEWIKPKAIKKIKKRYKKNGIEL